MRLPYPVLTLFVIACTFAPQSTSVQATVQPDRRADHGAFGAHAAAAAGNNRVAVPFGKAQDDSDDAFPKSGKGYLPTNDAAGPHERTYLVTLDRFSSLPTRDKVLQFLIDRGAVIKQEYDYRVFKGILYTVAASADRGLTSWQSSLTNLDGVRAVELDSVVRTSNE
ncbi:hypothetical protein OIO90_002874 [Microbotryomycetes sp. JL221]|nr:hypothetical protein OIO90_002874 [Microbotryomycetes sp. JL221]